MNTNLNHKPDCICVYCEAGRRKNAPIVAPADAIPKRPEPGSMHNSREFDYQCQQNEHAVAKALWEALILHGCGPSTRNYSICPGCDAMVRVKTSGWQP